MFKNPNEPVRTGSEINPRKDRKGPAYLPPLIPEGGAGHESESNMGEYEDNHSDQNYNGTEHHRITPKPKTTSTTGYRRPAEKEKRIILRVILTIN